MDARDRIEREIAACENGDYGDGPLWIYLMGWADWQTEKELLRQEQKELPGASESRPNSSW